MNYAKQALSILLLLSLSLFVHAEKLQESTVDELLVLSGLKSQMQDIPDAIVMMMEQGLPNLSAEKKKQLQVTFSRVFNPDLVLKDISNEIQNSMSAQDAKQVLAWYESNAGTRIASAEEYASTPEAMQEFQKVVPELMSNSELLANVQKLIDEMMLMDESIAFQRSMMLATLVGMNQTTKPDQAIEMEELKSFVDMQINQSKGNLQQMLTAQLAFAYKDIDKSAMDEYLAVLKTPAMKKFNGSQYAGSKLALDKALERLLATE